MGSFESMKYWITEVCHGENHIEKVKIFKNTSKPEIWTKDEVVESIKNGNDINSIDYLGKLTFVDYVHFVTPPLFA